ncbi:hypothetical protein DOTSEDRAFT_87070 [Dothistroma septosporum NZE10]|uniref:Glycerate kinase n=1 Tax=Dothistroma septosporum (strain NZE10 / CBS 128990) TaxID=675120 RepID=N1PUB5_DOTSN|nr:hypothetical protein DOTSEDRAFT_87070 [Dothistroma septosporum NZE10]
MTESPRSVPPHVKYHNLPSGRATDCIEAGVLQSVAGMINLIEAPIIGGGEGFTEALLQLDVMGPVRESIPSHFGFLGGAATKTAMIVLAAAANLSVVPRHQRNFLYKSTFGVDQLLRVALVEGADHILFDCGDSETCDGGVGMTQALGASPPLFWQQGRMNSPGSRRGVARVLGAKKGATPAEVELLSSAMNSVASVAPQNFDRKISLVLGIGVSGGVTLRPHLDIITNFLNTTSLVESSDLIITAEGGIDEQTPRGRIPSAVARITKLQDIPVITPAGTVGVGAEKSNGAGIDVYSSVLQGSVTLHMAIAQAERISTDAAETRESAMRMVMFGRRLEKTMTPRSWEGLRQRSRR